MAKRPSKKDPQRPAKKGPHLYSKKDPHKKREAKSYEHPVASREIILQYMEEKDSPITFKDLLVAFNIQSEEEHEGLRRRIKAMERDGQIMRNRKGSYALVNKMHLLAGRVVSNREGFGFFTPDKGGHDIFIPESDMRGLFTDDRVLIRVDKQGRRSEGRVVEVLERNTESLVGRLIDEGSLLFVSPTSKVIPQDILIAPNGLGGATPGDYVVVEIVSQPTKRHLPTGKITEVLGDQLQPGLEFELSVRSHRLPFKWSKDVERQAGKLSTTLSKKDIKGRRDLRDLPFVTIDGADSRDFDDAVYCVPREEGGWKLYVAIADVSHYVTVDSAIDKEAKGRGTSVYFPSKVIPMLPEILSNDLCSLKPNVDRLCMVCEMDVSESGEVTSSQSYSAVMHSHARLTYSKVAGMLKSGLNQQHPLLPQIKDLHSLYLKLAEKRQQRGALEFETTETRIVFDKQGKISHIKPVERNVAHKMIEEAMLLANISIANILEQAKIHTLYRVHATPDEDKLSDLRDFLKTFGLRLSGGKKPATIDYANLLKRINKRADAHLIQTVLLRSLKQAIYFPENSGHFGLAYEGYTHFTSPIRRYPDLLVHRALKHLETNKNIKKFHYKLYDMTELGQHCSMTERRADRAVRDATDWLKCDYMLDKVGQSFEGMIVDVTGFGVFVELKDIYVQGLLHITSLKNDYYIYEPTQQLLRGRNSGKTYRLGDTIKVMVARADLDDRKIDFELA